MMNDDILKLTIEGTDTSYKREISQDQFARIALLLTKPASSIKTEEEHVVASQLSIREFLNEKMPVTNPQKIAVIAFYLKNKDYKSVSAEVFKQYFENAAEPIPKNITRDIKEAVKLGWITESYKNEGYFITASGEAKVQSGFKESDIFSKRSKKGSMKRTFKPVTVRAEIERVIVDPIIPDFKNYWDLNKGEKILWICAQMSQKSFQKLNFKEIPYLADKIGDHIKGNSISGLMAPHTRVNRVNMPQEDGIRYVQILKPGLDFILKSVPSEKVQ